jgi:DNA-binding MarR family transcriptional regulator
MVKSLYRVQRQNARRGSRESYWLPIQANVNGIDVIAAFFEMFALHHHSVASMKSFGRKRPKEPLRAQRSPRVQRRALKRLHALDEAVELLYYGQLGAIRDADDYLCDYGFSQGHHRVLYILARHDGLSVGDLIKMLGISKQAAQRPLKQLSDAGFVSASRDPTQHRVKILELTKSGRELEHQATSRKRAVIKKALGDDAAVQEVWMKVMRVIADRA